ncbi:helix-turn-helix domain-containing protein [Streptomyces sp. NBC_01433]|uniref:helix-turn-helix domain-containing protein n=1 Tax=Streptomyces sp. NBC_01433 TaxID=2903864 RepID=UPI002250052C|nr:helix-turn-helix transcriptional regulator [Streptomyces sp. NBC_01433]MCX4681447.1 helix-turn-helix domain-containing protein [Streptomyces sp. NBC_01433]
MTQKRATSTVWRRRVGAQLRRWREPVMKAGDAAKVMGWDSTRLSRVERGQYRVSSDEVRTLAAHLGVDDEVAVSEVARVAERPLGGGWWAPYAGRIGDAYLDFIELEADARAIRIHHPTVVPAPLQSAGYVREILTRAATNLTPERAEMLVSIRMARQGILTSDEGPVKLNVLVPELALHARFESGPGVMRDQIRRLLDATELPNVNLQLVPLTAHPAFVTKGPVTLMSFSHPWVPIGSVDSPLGGTHTEEPEKVSWMEEEFDLISSIALPVDASRERLSEYLEGLYK